MAQSENMNVKSKRSKTKEVDRNVRKVRTRARPAVASTSRQQANVGMPKAAAAPASSSSEHALKIARYHTLEKQIARSSGREKQILLAEQKKLGGLSLYQQASLQGARHGETSKWLVLTVEANYGGRKNRRLLDVGAIAGTSYAKYKSIDPTYIDLNPAADHVIKADFLTYPVPETPFDIVCLSLVINFVGDLESRTEMLRRAQLFVHSEGLLYLVLPRACVQNSRYMDEERLRGLLQTLGWQVEQEHISAGLAHYLCSKCEANDTTWPRREVKGGATRNNFVIIVK